MSETRFLKTGAHILDLVVFRRALIAWGRAHFRPFPWRLTENPYHILVAEVMLHRTQAKQVIPVYERFVEAYPDITSLAQTSLSDLHAILHSLGLHWRINLLHKMAIEIVVRYDGEIPREKRDLVSLPGVSDYIASAVRCFAWNLPEALIDTNTVRVVCRLIGLETRDSLRRNRRFQNIMRILVDEDDPRTYNYALLDLAAIVCNKRRPPQCHICPLNELCLYARTHR